MRIFAVLSLLFLVSCTDPNGAKRVAEDQGYRSVQITGYRFFGCGNDDEVHTGFTAISPSGRFVSGVVCSGFSLFGKSYTLRLD